MTIVGIFCAAACVLMMVAMMGGAGWLMRKLRPLESDTSGVQRSA